jgi:hypothetical protein
LVLTGICSGGQNFQVKAALHVLPHEDRDCSTDFFNDTATTEIYTTYEGCGGFDVFPVFFDLVEVTRLQYGLTWPSDWGTCVFTPCAGDQVEGAISSPGDGVTHMWDVCYETSVVVTGFAWFGPVAPPATISLTVNPTASFIGPTDCSGSSDFLIGLAAAGVCGIPGEDPCDCGCPVDPQTWGAIKRLFE